MIGAGTPLAGGKSLGLSARKPVPMQEIFSGKFARNFFLYKVRRLKCSP